MKSIVSREQAVKVMRKMDELVAFADEIDDHVLAAILDSARNQFNTSYLTGSDGLAGT